MFEILTLYSQNLLDRFLLIFFSPNGRYLVVDYLPVLFYDRSRDVVMATDFSSKIGIFTFICCSHVPKRIGMSQCR